MCGICGINGFRDDKFINEMTSILEHRGPNDEGYYFSNETSLGHRRLSIIDLKTGKQPIYNETKNIVTIFNGEIYNYKSLRQTLIQHRHIFKTNSDTEVIVHAYEEYGPNFVKKLDGMFAIALWDNTKKSLFLYRDRLGIKPIYYYRDHNRFIFASELKAITLYSNFEKKINKQAVNEYFSRRYVPKNMTIFENIYKLEAGNYLIYQEQKLKKVVYWSPLDIKEKSCNPNEALEEFTALFNNSVKSRLISDVPLGAYISGGVDSTSVLDYMTNIKGENINAFHIVFSKNESDFELSKKLSEQYNANFIYKIIHENDFCELREVVRFLDEPYGDLIVLAMYKLSKITRNNVKVVLTGEGADECLNGYYYQQQIYNLMKYQGIIKKFKHLINFILKLTPVNILDYFFSYSSKFGQFGKRRLQNIIDSSSNLGELYFHTNRLFTYDTRKKLLNPNWITSTDIDEKNYINKQCNGLPTYKDIIKLEFINWLPENILFTVDRMTMAHSIEARVPFLDHKLVEFCLSLPTEFLINSKTNKILLRQYLENKRCVTKERSRMAKKSFRVPIEDAYPGLMKKLIDVYLTKNKINETGIINCEYVELLLNNIDKKGVLAYMQLISIIMFQIWWDVYMN